VKPAPFESAAPTTVGEAVELLASTEEAKPIAGGQSLVPLLALRLARPALLVDLNGIDELARTTRSANGLRLGAMTRQYELPASDHPLLATAAPWIAHAAIRSRGTVGGSIAHADPAAELPLVALASGATMAATGPARTRTIAAGDFFDGPLQTALDDDELLTAVEFLFPQRWGFAELARRQGDFALVLVAVTQIDGAWRIAVGGVEGTPVRMTRAEEAATTGSFEEAARLAGESVSAYDNLHATASYQRGMTTELVRRALADAVRR
jgi:carbon-monoxide dehydrogenase medium subunit